MPISRIIEHEQASIFYPFMKYLNQDEGNLFHYTIGLNSSAHSVFYIKQNTQVIYHVDPELFDYSDEPLNDKNQFIWEGDFNPSSGKILKNSIQSELICEKWKNDVVIYPGQEPDFPTEKIILKKDDIYQYTCQKLFLKDQLISSSPLNIENWLSSEDGNWLLLHLNQGFYNPEEVHLLDLRRITSKLSVER